MTIRILGADRAKPLTPTTRYGARRSPPRRPATSTGAVRYRGIGEDGAGELAHLLASDEVGGRRRELPADQIVVHRHLSILPSDDDPHSRRGPGETLDTHDPLWCTTIATAKAGDFDGGGA